jgi:DNA-binding NtrC family response regulator
LVSHEVKKLDMLFDSVDNSDIIDQKETRVKECVMQEEMLTPKDAAKYLGISEMTMYRRMKEKGIKPTNYNPMLRRQKEPRYSKADLDKMKEQFAIAAA